MSTTTQTRQAVRQVKLRERQSMAYLILFSFLAKEWRIQHTPGL